MKLCWNYSVTKIKYEELQIVEYILCQTLPAGKHFSTLEEGFAGSSGFLFSLTSFGLAAAAANMFFSLLGLDSSGFLRENPETFLGDCFPLIGEDFETLVVFPATTGSVSFCCLSFIALSFAILLLASATLTRAFFNRGSCRSLKASLQRIGPKLKMQRKSIKLSAASLKKFSKSSHTRYSKLTLLEFSLVYPSKIH